MSVSHAQLKAFHAVAVHGSFTKAAERLFLTQPAISDQVRKLEERFGVLLFHRNKRSVRLTDLGERLLAITQRLFVIEAEAQELLQESQALQTGSLILAVDAPVHVLPQIARFCQRYPGIQVKIETGNTDESLARLMEVLRIPSISTDPAFKPACARAADWLVSLLVFGFCQPDLLIRIRLLADRDTDPHVQQFVQGEIVRQIHGVAVFIGKAHCVRPLLGGIPFSLVKGAHLR